MDKDQSAMPLQATDRKTRVAKDTVSDTVSISSTKDDKIKLRRVHSYLNNMVSTAEQIGDAIGNDPNKALRVYEAVKKLNAQTEEVMSQLGY